MLTNNTCFDNGNDNVRRRRLGVNQNRGCDRSGDNWNHDFTSSNNMKAFSNVVLLDPSGTGFGVILTDTHITTCVGDPPLHRDINCVGLAPALADVDGIMARTTCALHQLSTVCETVHKLQQLEAHGSWLSTTRATVHTNSL